MTQHELLPPAATKEWMVRLGEWWLSHSITDGNVNTLFFLETKPMDPNPQPMNTCNNAL